MLGEFASLFSEISVKDPAASTSSGVRNRGEVVNGVLQAVLKGTEVSSIGVHSVDGVVRVDSAATAAEALDTDRPAIDLPPPALSVGSFTS